MDCLFCKIVSGAIPSHKVYEDEFSFAFLDIDPCSSGHTIVIPKKHFERFTDMDTYDAGNLFESVNTVAKAVEVALGVKGSNIGLNNGKVAGQEVPHVHVHIIPRAEGDKGGAIQSVVNTKPDKDNIGVVCERIKGAF